MGTMLFCGAVHIAQRQTSKELIADANLLSVNGPLTSGVLLK